MRGDSLRGEVVETWLGMASLGKRKVQLDTWGREEEASWHPVRISIKVISDDLIKLRVYYLKPTIICVY